MNIAKWVALALGLLAGAAVAQQAPPAMLARPLGVPASQVTSAGTPVMFQHVGTSTNPIGFGITGRAFVFQTESLPANSVIAMAVTAPHGKVVTVSDTLASSWSSPVCTADAGTGNYLTAVFVQALGPTGGTDTITVGVGASNTQPVQVEYTIFTNINTTATTGGSLCTANITPNGSALINPGSFTPANNNLNGGDIIWNANAVCAAAGSNASGWTAASGFTLLDGDIIWTNDQGFPKAAQYELLTTAASVTPSITSTGDTTDCFNSVTVALQANNNHASAPSTIHVARIIHESTAGYASPGSGLKVMLPTAGNLRVATFSWAALQPGGGPGTLTGLTSSDGCTWAIRNDNAGAGVAYAQNCSPCATCTLTLNWTGTQTLAQLSFRLYDIENAAASSFQNSAGNQYVCGTTLSNAPSITPTGASSGLAISVLQNGNGPVTAVTSPSGTTFDLWLFTGIADGDMADNADFSGHYYYNSLAAQNYDYTKTNGSDDCAGEVATFN